MRSLAWVFASVAAVGLAQLGSEAARRNGDGGVALKAQINGPSSISVDHQGNLYVYELAGGAVRKIGAFSRVITTLATACQPPWAEPIPKGCIGPISDLHLDANGGLMFSEFTYNKLSRLDMPGRTLSVVAGNGELKSTGDGGPAARAGITVSHCFTFDSKSNILVCDSSYRIRRISAESGSISTVAGCGKRGFAGDHGPAIEAEFGTLVSIAVDRWDNIYFADDASNRIRRIDAKTGIVEAIGGSGPIITGSLAPVEFKGEGGPATDSRFTSPRSLVFDREGNLLFTTAGRICQIDREGRLRTVAGVGRDGFGGDGGAAKKAIIGPSGLAFDDLGNLFVAEYENNRIRRIDASTGVITTVGGNGLPHRPPTAIM